MVSLLSGTPGVIPYVDDVLITGATEGELAERLHDVLCHFDKSGLCLKKIKMIKLELLLLSS